MIEQQGRVVGLSGGFAQVRVGAATGCAQCDAGQGCGAGLFSRLIRRQVVELTVDNDVDADIGEAVVLAIPETLYLHLVWRLYGLPLLAGLAGAAFGHQICAWSVGEGGVQDVATLLGGLVGWGIALAWRSVRRERLIGRMPLKLIRPESGAVRCPGTTV